VRGIRYSLRGSDLPLQGGFTSGRWHA
jgi:hypothetical protein